MIADYIDELIMFAAGLWMTAVGFGYMSLPAGQAHLLKFMKWGGPLLLAIAIVLAIAK
ncbi:hypothetical protein M8997_001745 [Phyllobacterium sp. 21LDTY02-6]|jgi:hypothetical protein|uniref:hypothetical protein n=1 Tax=unclassified Phyllobacterium TaxID=2638441 RepID=UPI002020AC16|nr:MULTISPECIES: hypothetical protein [unclassified Phyllobacterium]MCO4315892.1 hypothetical protein [Phyllobacterium sp. 21LDTY02-6]MCX8279684.1 hypothetical protein [Phyllobacterium sp. 0TCS1.6C]MCX8292125.1 hypothetical protein [Phyllobacterium sp. 0TCS1.6A]